MDELSKINMLVRGDKLCINTISSLTTYYLFLMNGSRKLEKVITVKQCQTRIVTEILDTITCFNTKVDNAQKQPTSNKLKGKLVFASV